MKFLNNHSGQWGTYGLQKIYVITSGSTLNLTWTKTNWSGGSYSSGQAFTNSYVVHGGSFTTKAWSNEGFVQSNIITSQTNWNANVSSGTCMGKASVTVNGKGILMGSGGFREVNTNNNNWVAIYFLVIVI